MKILKIGLILMTYCLVFAFALGVVRTITKPRQEAVERLQRMSAVKNVLPQAEKFVEKKLKSGVSYYLGVTRGDTVGYVIEGKEYGFSSDIVAMVGMDKDFNIQKIEVVTQSETPGLGNKVSEDWFENQFSGKSLAQIKLERNGGEIKDITGATISSKAITKAVRETVKKLQGELSR